MKALSVLALAVSIALAGCASPQEARGGEGAGEGNATARLGDVTAPAADIALSGEGSGRSANFTTQVPVVRFDLRFEGEGPFRATLLAADGDVLQDLAEGEAPWNGSRYASLAAGSYALEVVAPGAWEATVVQDEGARAAGPPQEWRGTGTAAAGAVRLEEGMATFNVTLAGDGAVEAWLVAPDGRNVMKIADLDAAGADGATVRIREAGVYSVNVEGDGAWLVRVTQ